MKKVWSKYKELPVTVKASAWFVICSIFQKGVNLVTVPLFTRLLTTEQYGQFSVYQSWYSIVIIFATLNLFYGVFNTAMIKYPDDRNRYISSVQGLASTVTLLLLVIYLPLRNYINELTGLSTLITLVMFAEFFTMPALSFWTARQRYEFKYAALVGVTIGMSVLSPIVGVIAVSLTEEKGVARIVSAALVNICVGLFFYVFNVVKGKKVYNKEYWKFSLGFNLPLVPHYLAQIILGQADRVMIDNMFGESKVAIYSVAHSFSLVMNIVTNGINSSFVPWTYNKLAEKDITPLKKMPTVLLFGVAAIALFPVFVAPELMWIVAPPEYSEAIWVIPPISTSVYFMFVGILATNVEFFYEKTNFGMVASVLTAALNIVLNALLMPKFGYMAAGYTTMISYMLYAFAHYMFMKKVCKEKLGVKSVYNDKLVVLITVAYLVCTAIAMCLYNFTIIRYAILLIAFIVIIIKREKVIEIVKNIKKKD